MPLSLSKLVGFGSLPISSLKRVAILFAPPPFKTISRYFFAVGELNIPSSTTLKNASALSTSARSEERRVGKEC